MAAGHVSKIERMALSCFFIELKFQAGPIHTTLEKFENEFLRFEERF